LTTRKEHDERYGCYRIGVDPKIVNPWMKMQRIARIHPTAARSYEKIGREWGANPYDWWGTLRPVPNDVWIQMQILRDDKWDDLTLKDLLSMKEEMEDRVRISADRENRPEMFFQ
jgi:hypothetical protein